MSIFLLSNMVATTHKWLILNFKQLSESKNSLMIQVTFQVFNSLTWLVASMLARGEMKHFHHHRKFY